MYFPESHPKVVIKYWKERYPNVAENAFIYHKKLESNLAKLRDSNGDSDRIRVRLPKVEGITKDGGLVMERITEDQTDSHEELVNNEPEKLEQQFMNLLCAGFIYSQDILDPYHGFNYGNILFASDGTFVLIDPQIFFSIPEDHNMDKEIFTLEQNPNGEGLVEATTTVRKASETLSPLFVEGVHLMLESRKHSVNK